MEALLQLFEDKARQLAKDSEVHRNEVRVRFIGKLELLPESLQREIRKVEEATAGYGRFQLNIAMAYGGREEISDALTTLPPRRGGRRPQSWRTVAHEPSKGRPWNPTSTPTASRSRT